MSTIHAPYPVPDVWQQDPLAAPRPQELCWWRFRLEENDDHQILIVRSDATKDMQDATWVSWEFFDGATATIGLNEVQRVRMNQRFATGYIDILARHEQPPTPSPLWFRITEPGDVIHPDGPIADWADG